jgi:hypothetical protein
MTPLLIAVLLMATPSDLPEVVLTAWPDDALVEYLALAAEFEMTAWNEDKPSKPSALVRGVADEAARRRFIAAIPVLKRLYERIPLWEDCVAMRAPYGNGYPPSLAKPLGRLEVETGEWDRIVATYAPAFEAIECDAPGRRTLNRLELLAGAVGSAMMESERGRQELRALASRPSTCMRRYIAMQFNADRSKLSDEDRAVLRSLLTEIDELTQMMALRALMRGLSPAEQKKLALEYLASPTKVGKEGEAFAQQILEGKSRSDEETRRMEEMNRRLDPRLRYGKSARNR